MVAKAVISLTVSDMRNAVRFREYSEENRSICSTDLGDLEETTASKLPLQIQGRSWRKLPGMANLHTPSLGGGGNNLEA